MYFIWARYHLNSGTIYALVICLASTNIKRKKNDQKNEQALKMSIFTFFTNAFECFPLLYQGTTILKNRIPGQKMCAGL